MDDKIVFRKDLAGYNNLKSIGKVTHILCEKGGFSFLQNHIRYNVSEGDLVIFLNGVIVSDIRVSMDFKGITLEFSESFFYTDNVRNNYIIIGHLSLLKEPVIRLSDRQFNICRSSLTILEEKLKDKDNLFHEELIGALLKVHVLEILNIHASIYSKISPDSRPASIMAKFISMLEDGNFIHHRELTFYASELCISPHYLSEVSKLASGQPASYWIERFTLQSLLSHIINQKCTLSELMYKFNFSSLSHISRFIKKHTGKSYSQLLQIVKRKD
ncbi:MAG: AraC family transcriptional regulator [Muribaculaceae bacterium]|nr:AraC family transcriptional regulator [Muribaculaceae bacterium]